MARVVVYIATLLILLSIQPAHAMQDARAGVHVDTLHVAAGDTLQLRPFIIEGTEVLHLNGVRLDSANVSINYRYGRLVLRDREAAGILVAAYQTLPFSFDLIYQLNDEHRIESEPDSSTLFSDISAQEERETQAVRDPFGDSRVRRSGSITRGVVAGSNKDVTVESGLRMQLAGEIVDGVNIQAVLTDENTPIQPEGTTQRLNEFDRVFIQIQSRQGTVQLGDFDVQYQNSEFAQFSRKLQGVHLFSDIPSLQGNQPALSIDVAGATSRGIFRTQEIEPIDGVQGPYRLEGENGEQFIIIVAGSEVVYLDGQPMTRGESNDYVIDYATGEITFTPNRIITSDRRLSVEFQYTTNQFSRTLTSSSVTAHLWPAANGNARTSFGINFIREADGDLFNDEFGLTGIDSLQIIGAGDGLAQSSGAELVQYDPEAPFVQYTREIELSGDTVFVAIDERPADSVDVFRVRFTRVGAGRGSYARQGRGVNGILYEYRGENQGDYEPIRILPTPENHNVLNFHGRFEPIRNIELFGEWARSFNDQNRLSVLDRVDDVDRAVKGGVRMKPIPIDFGFAQAGHVEGEVRRRFIGAHFESFNRIRPVEFGRQWNLNARTISATGGVEGGGDEQIDEASAALYLSPNTFIRGEMGAIDLGGVFEGRRRSLGLAATERLTFTAEWIDSEDTLLAEDGTWFRQRGTVRQPVFGSRLTPFFELEQERREQKAAGLDSLTQASLAFVEYRPGIDWTGDRLTAGLQFELRDEDDWADGRLRDAARASTYQARFDFRPGTQFNTEGSVGYRVRRVTEYFRVNGRLEDTESVLLRWNSQWRPMKRAVDLTTRYEASTERTPTLQEIYIRTGPELGQFVWVDDNADGVIQIDEFLPEQTPNEGTYVKTFVPSDSLSSIISVQARVRLLLEPGRIWGKDSAGLKKILSHISTRTTVEIQEKSRDDRLADIYLLKASRFRSAENTLNGRLRLSQDVLLFRTLPKIGLDIRFNQLRSLTELAAGEEERFLNVWSFESRYAPTTRWGFKISGSTETNRLGSESFASRRYRIEGYRTEPEISFSPSNAVSIVGRAGWAKKHDAEGNRDASVLKLPLEVRLRQVRRSQVTIRGEVAFVDLTGEARGLAEFELTDGRGPGTSYLWGINGDYTLNQYLRLSFAYDGRAPADAPVLHTVRVQLSALF